MCNASGLIGDGNASFGLAFFRVLYLLVDYSMFQNCTNCTNILFVLLITQLRLTLLFE